jgi:3-oxosteroid 1-dehydrogenase
MGTSYPGAGSSVGPSFVWGYVAAKYAASHAAADRSIDEQRPAA